MASRITFFDHFMQPLRVQVTDIPTTPRSWVLNEYGKAEFEMQLDDPKCTLRNLNFGNLVRIEHLPTEVKNDAGIVTGYLGKLPDWYGIILPPRTWGIDNVSITVYGIEAVLAFRAMPYMTLTGMTPKNMFLEILSQANKRASNIVIQPGIVNDLSLTFSDDLRTNAYDHIKKLSKVSGMDWNITGEIGNNGNMILTANLFNNSGTYNAQARSNDTPSPVVLDNLNSESSAPLLTEQGTITNQIYAMSSASSPEARTSSFVSIPDSVNDYGPLQINQVYLGQHDATSIDNSARSRIERRGRPVKMIGRTALDNGDLLSRLKVGQLAYVKDTRVGFNPNGGFGFSSYVKILSMTYNDLSNKVPLNVEVIQ